MLQYANQQTADDVNDHDQNTGDGIAANELTRTVHRTVEVSFLSDFRTTLLRFIFPDDPGVQVGIDSHLFTRHPVQHEARANFRDTPGTLGDNHKVDDNENDKHHDTDGEVTADQEVAEGFNHLPCRRRAGMPVHQNDTGRGHVQRQAQQGGKQQNGRERGKLQGTLGEHRHQQHHNRQRNVKGKQQVEDEGRQRQHHHRQDKQNQHRPGKHLPLSGFQVAGKTQHCDKISHQSPSRSKNPVPLAPVSYPVFSAADRPRAASV